MKKLLLILASALLLASAHAQTTVDVSKLTPEQQAAVKKSIDSMKGEPNISQTAREETEKWVELGGNMGKAAVGAAKELGMAANEFVATPIGRVTMGVVVYKVIGKDVLKTITGFCVLVVFLCLAVWFAKRKHYSSIEYEYKPVFFGLYNKQVIKSGEIDQDWSVGHLACAALCAAIALAVGLNVMF